MEKLRIIPNDSGSRKYKFTIAIPPEQTNHAVILVHGLATHADHIKRIEQEISPETESFIRRLNPFKKREKIDLTQWTYVHGEYPSLSNTATITWTTQKNKIVAQPNSREIKIAHFALSTYARQANRKLTEVILTLSKPTLR